MPTRKKRSTIKPVLQQYYANNETTLKSIL